MHLLYSLLSIQTPELIVGMFPTTYHFYNTFDKDQKSLPLVITSKYTITNTITGPDLRLSEGLIPAYYTNTYFSRILLTRTLYDEELKKTITTVTSENYLTQVIITETPYYPAKDNQIIKPTSIISNDENNEFNESFSTTQIIKNIFLDSNVDPLKEPDYLLALNSKQKVNESGSIANQFGNLNNSMEYLSTEINTQYPKDIEKIHTFSSKKTTQLLVENIINHSNQYNTKIKPSKLYTNSLNSHSEIISTLNLDRFRPMLTIVAQLLKKQLLNSNTGETNLREKHPKTSLTNTNQMISENTLYYIPLKQTRQDKSKEGQQYLNVTNKRRENMNKLRINTLHIEPPKLYTFTSKNSPKELLKLSDPRPHFFETSSDITYENGFLNTGIAIRPGEVITASADVIFGRQTNLNERISHTQIFSGYYSTLSNHFLTTLKPSIPFIDFRSNTIRNDIILKPPPIPLHKQKQLLSMPSYEFIPLERSPDPIRFSHIDQSIDQYASLKFNTAFYSNQILNIFRQPQIFSTSQHDTSYDTFYFTSDFKTDQKTLKPILSTLLHQVNLRNDVLSHTINMHAPPITFKRETENSAHATAIKGLPINSFETPLLALKNYEVVTLKSKDLAFKGSALKYETKLSNLCSPENIKKGTGLTKYTSYVDKSNWKNEYPSLYLPKQEIPQILQENFYEHSTEYDQNADSSHDSPHVINAISKKKGIPRKETYIK